MCVRELCVLSERVLQSRKKMMFFCLSWYNTHDKICLLWHLVHSLCFASISAIYFQNILNIPKKKSRTPQPSSWPWSATNFWSLYGSNILYIQNHAMRGLVWLAAFAKLSIFKVHPCCRMCHYFILFYGWIFHRVHTRFYLRITIGWWVASRFGDVMNNSANVCVQVACGNICSHFSWVDTEERNCWVMWCVHI